MRLLVVNERGEFKVTKDLVDHIPPYAILSHTWGDDEDEITFDDVEKHQVTTKAGYLKLAFCMSQAQRDGLEHVWIDTCCINKASQSELSEAITSMFHWYRRATKCYVYLSDVKIEHSQLGTAPVDWQQGFCNSRWFTRGWTLQELIAPGSVEFFAYGGQRLGDKASLEELLHTVTGIPVAALRGPDLTGFPIEQRLQWATVRRTKRPEDRAYCMIGLCEVSMSLRYGEGDNAFARLESKVRKKGTGGITAQSSVSEAADISSGRESIMESLYFSDMDARKQQISPPSSGTFRWLLESQDESSSSFANFLRDNGYGSKLFWVSGIPGSGKSSLMAYLLDTLERDLAWRSPPSYFSGIIVSYFFWSPAGNVLQKSLTGMMRTVLYALFEQDPKSVRWSVTPRRWQRALSAASAPQWTQVELMEALRSYAHHKTPGEAVLIFIDGLDEIEGGISEQEALVDAVQAIANLPSIKLCVSSRPQPIFAEALSHGPLLRLQDLNGGDIAQYVKDAMYSQRSFLALDAQHPQNTQKLIDLIISRAEGVFLWVRLVVKDLITCLRDGGDYATLRSTLEDIPIDLKSYFQRLLDSIEPKYQAEASFMLQVALWEEEDFTSLQTLRLVDFCFLDVSRASLSQSASIRNPLDLNSIEDVKFKLSASFRKLQSRCKGLLTCHNMAPTDRLKGRRLSSAASDWSQSSNGRIVSESQIDDIARLMDGTLLGDSTGDRYGLLAFDFALSFLHRSLRDFLLSPSCFRSLLALTNGSVDVRRYLCLARLYEAEALMNAGLSVDMIVFLASHALSALATPAMRCDEETLLVLARLEPVIHHIVCQQSWRRRGLYIGTSLHAWHEEESSFLTLAVDFNIEIYLMRHLTSQQILLKKGRPLLDYVLRPRFVSNSELGIGLVLPDPALAARMINLGADPNTSYDGSSLFVLYLCFMSDYLRANVAEITEQELASFYETTVVLLQRPVPKSLPKMWLSHDGYFDVWSTTWRNEPDRTGRTDVQARLISRWGRGPPLRWVPGHGYLGDTLTADILENFRPFFGHRVSTLISELRHS